MAPGTGGRKPWWGWKSRGCAELEEFDVPFAVKEYMQNQVGQVLKQKKTREWSEWVREDLRESTQSEREARKAQLIQVYPGLLTGPHGAHIARTRSWQPNYVLTATIPHATLALPSTNYDLILCVVLWYHPSGVSGLSFFNNHLDVNAKFSTFVVDGATTSRHDVWAIGEKGKGFMLATQFLYETCEVNISKLQKRGVLPASPQKNQSTADIPKDLKAGVSFRIGHQIGELSWKISRDEDEDDQLRVVMDDLTPVTLDQMITRRGIVDDEAYMDEVDSDDDVEERKKPKEKTARSLAAMYKRRFTQKLSSKKPSVSEACRPSDEVCLARSDEVCITILGLSGLLSPDVVFSGIYGVVPPPRAWRPTPSLVEFFKSSSPTPSFYLRDQIIPNGPPLKLLSVNYHGDLSITADRRAIYTRGTHFDAYKAALLRAADTGLKDLPELAVELALDILGDSVNSGATIGHVLQPASNGGKEAYTAAFHAAWCKLDPELTVESLLWPYPASSDDLELIQELGMVGREVPNHVMRILERSEAFTRIQAHARALLLDAPPLDQAIPGFARLRRGIQILWPDIPDESIVIHDYKYSNPKVVWRDGFVIGSPPSCSVHEGGECLCWVGPYLDATVDSRRAEGGDAGSNCPDKAALYRAYQQCMAGVTNMHEPKPETEIDNMEVDNALLAADGPGSDDGSEAGEHNRGQSTDIWFPPPIINPSRTTSHSLPNSQPSSSQDATPERMSTTVHPSEPPTAAPGSSRLHSVAPQLAPDHDMAAPLAALDDPLTYAIKIIQNAYVEQKQQRDASLRRADTLEGELAVLQVRLHEEQAGLHEQVAVLNKEKIDLENELEVTRNLLERSWRKEPEAGNKRRREE